MENGKSIAFYLDESDLEKIETLKKTLKMKNNSMLMRYLVHEKYHDFMQYKNGYDSDKQIINYSHSSKVNKKII